MVNKVILIGNLGRDPEIRSTTSGTPVANFSLATNRKWRDRDGNPQEQTEWHNIVCFGRQAEVAGQYLTRGRQLFVEGRLQTSSWEDRQSGEKRYRTEIICDNFQMLGGGGGQRGSGAPPVSAYDGTTQQPAGGGGAADAGGQDPGSYGGGGGGAGDAGGGGGAGGASGAGGAGGAEPEDDDIPF